MSVFVRAFKHVAEVMRLPRTLITQHPMGRPLGASGDRDRQRRVISSALELLENAPSGATVVELDEPWRAGNVAR